jgi:glycosyltransferase involved in cell wall biosynthesis
MPSIAIIIPCYNEAKRIQISEFARFSNEHEDIEFYFVNDGSTDDTENLLFKIKESSPSKIISSIKNRGKGNAIRKGLVTALEDGFDLVGYLDADLSTSLEEFLRLKNLLINERLDLVLGSRIKKIDTVIQRSFFRHIVGRIIATIIDQKFKLGVYDTQCGAKIFRSFLLREIIDEPFRTRWFFDVELLLRIRKQHPDCNAAEIPLNRWHNVLNSKLSILSFPSVLKDLFVLVNKY